jgi:hypothetical protein
MSSPKGIFICYRRDDAEGYAGRIYDRLHARFPGRVFMDVTGINPGADFNRVIQDTVGSCHVLLAIIGKQWLTISDSTTKPRIQRDDDYVRHEIATALYRNIAVIPVLVREAKMPASDSLPPDLASLSTRNALEISDDDFEHDAQRLISAIEYVMGETRVAPPAPPAKSSYRTCLILALVGILVVGGGFLLMFFAKVLLKPNPNNQTYEPTPAQTYSNEPTSEPTQGSIAPSASFNPVGSWQLRLEGNGQIHQFNVDIHSDHTYQYVDQEDGTRASGYWQYDGELLSFASNSGAFSISIDARSGNAYLGHANIGDLQFRAFLTPRD